MLHRDAQGKVLRLGLHHRLVDPDSSAGLQLDFGEAADIFRGLALVEEGDAALRADPSEPVGLGDEEVPGPGDAVLPREDRLDVPGQQAVQRGVDQEHAHGARHRELDRVIHVNVGPTI